MLALLALAVTAPPPGAVAVFGSPRLADDPTPLVLSPDGTRLGGVRDRRAVVLPLAGGPPEFTPADRFVAAYADPAWAANGDLRWVAWGPAGFGCGVRRPDGTVATPPPPVAGPGRQLFDARLTPDGTAVLTAWQLAGNPLTRRVELWPFVAGKASQELEMTRVVEVADATQMTVRGGCFSGDSTHFLVVDRNQLAGYTLATGKRAWELKPDVADIRSVASHDGRTVTVVHANDPRRPEATAWHAPTGKRLGRLSDAQPAAVAVLPDNKRAVVLAPAADGRLAGTVVDLATGDPVRSLDPLPGQAGRPLHVGVSRDGRRVAAFGYRTTAVWDVETGKDAQTAPGHRGRVTGLLFSADGKWVVSAGEDRTVRCWSADAGVEKWAAGVPGDVSLGGFTPDGSAVLVAADGQRVGGRKFGPRVLKLADGKPLPLPEKLADPAAELVAFSPDGKTVAAANEEGLRLLTWPGGRPLRAIPFDPPAGRWHRFAVSQVRFTADGKELVAVCGYDRLEGVVSRDGPPHRVERYAADSGQFRSAVVVSTGRPLLVPAFGRLGYLTTGADPTVFDAADGSAVGRLGYAGKATAVTAWPDGRRLVVAAGDGLRVFAPADGFDRGTWPPAERPVTALAVSPDGRWLATGDAAGVCVVWDADRHLP